MVYGSSGVAFATTVGNQWNKPTTRTIDVPVSLGQTDGKRQGTVKLSLLVLLTHEDSVANIGSRPPYQAIGTTCTWRNHPQRVLNFAHTIFSQTSLAHRLPDAVCLRSLTIK